MLSCQEKKGIVPGTSKIVHGFSTIPSFVLIETYQPTNNGYRAVFFYSSLSQ